jgi:hypothetical protein
MNQIASAHVDRYGYLIGGVAVLSFGAVVLFWLWRRSAKLAPLTVVDVILIWPVLFAAARGSRRAARLSTLILGALCLIVMAGGLYFVFSD